MTEQYLLSTIDNPFNPFTQNDSWFQFDFQFGYHSNELLAKFALTSNDLSDEENRQEIESAIDRIIAIDPTGLYVKVTENGKVINGVNIPYAATTTPTGEATDNNE